jgi:hypothetical protein
VEKRRKRSDFLPIKLINFAKEKWGFSHGETPLNLA